jgi:DNA-binding MarR family transcriptional regulator
MGKTKTKTKTKTNEGFAMIPNSLARCGLLTPKSMAIYLCLKSHAGTSNRTWLSHKTIGKESNVSPSAVKTGLNELRDLGLVTWKGRIRPSDGRQTTNNYVLPNVSMALGRLLETALQPSENYQVEEPFEEEGLNSSSDGRARIRNAPSRDKPATLKQMQLIECLFEELSMEIQAHMLADEQANLSRYDADALINELKTEKWKKEQYH